MSKEFGENREACCRNCLGLDPSAVEKTHDVGDVPKRGRSCKKQDLTPPFSFGPYLSVACLIMASMDTLIAHTLSTVAVDAVDAAGSTLGLQENVRAVRPPLRNG